MVEHQSPQPKFTIVFARKAIMTKYLPATNYRASRIKAWTEGGNSVTVAYPHELSGAAVFMHAAIVLCKKMNWTGTLVAGGTPDGYCFVFTEAGTHQITADVLASYRREVA